MNKMSTGQDSTLGNHRKFAVAIFGAESPAVAFLDQKIEEQGENEEVIVEEGQFINALMTMHQSGSQQNGN